MPSRERERGKASKCEIGRGYILHKSLYKSSLIFFSFFVCARMCIQVCRSHRGKCSWGSPSPQIKKIGRFRWFICIPRRSTVPLSHVWGLALGSAALAFPIGRRAKPSPRRSRLKEGTFARENTNKFVFFARLFVPLCPETKEMYENGAEDTNFREKISLCENKQ